MSLQLHRLTLGETPVLVAEDHSLPLVWLNVVLRDGSFLDPPGRAGAHRIMSEMWLRGTLQRSRRDFNAQLEQLGTIFNVMVGTERATLCVVSLARNIDSSVSLLAEALATPAFVADEVSALVSEVVDELRADRDEDDQVAEVFLRRHLYGAHPLGRSASGTVSDLLALGRDEVLALHQQRVTKQNILIALGGDVTPQRAEEIARQLTAQLPNTGGTSVPRQPVLAPDETRVLLVDKPGRVQSQLRLATPVMSGNDPEITGFWLGATAFGGTFTSPFCRQVRDERGWSYVANASFNRHSLDRAPLVLRTAPSVQDAMACLELELELFAELARGNIAIETVEQGRDFLLNRDPLDRASAEMVLPAMVQNELLGLPPDAIYRTPELLGGLQAGAIGSIMSDNLTPGGVVVVMVAPAAMFEDVLRRQYGDANVEVVDFRDGLGLDTL